MVLDGFGSAIRHAERLARERGEDGDAVVKAWLREVCGRESWAR